MKKLKPLQDYTVARSEKVTGRVRITLVTADNELRTYLSPEVAERFAAAILTARFDLPPPVLFNPPVRQRKAPVWVNFASTPTDIGSRPYVSEETLRLVEQRGDVEVRSRLAKELAKWDKKFERKNRRKWDDHLPPRGFLKGRKQSAQ